MCTAREARLSGRLYIVTVGREVGIFSRWYVLHPILPSYFFLSSSIREEVALSIDGVENAVWTRVLSNDIDEAHQRINKILRKGGLRTVDP
jgi:hypothetical protein